MPGQVPCVSFWTYREYMIPRGRERLERYFEFDRLGTNWRTELLAGVTTFMTMAYIIS